MDSLSSSNATSTTVRSDDAVSDASPPARSVSVSLPATVPSFPATIPSFSSSNFPADILRGVHLSRLMTSTSFRHYKIWTTGPVAMSEGSRVELWELSTSITHLDRFLSHAWRTPGWTKYMQLVLRLNWKYAVAYMFAAFVCCVFLTALDVLPIFCSFEQDTSPLIPKRLEIGAWCTLCVPLLGVLGLVVSSAHPRCGHEPIVFLDVVCINQLDDSLKAAGIRALGCYLRKSAQLHVMWSPDYFSRLWCVYELAVFVHMKGMDKIKWRPLFIDSALFVYFCTEWFGQAVYMMTTCLPMKHHKYTVSLLSWMPFLWLSHAIRLFMREKHTLADQLEHFDVASADCSDDTDRSFIMSSIQRWYGNEEQFNAQVRGPLRVTVLQKANTHTLRFGVAFLATSPPLFCKVMDMSFGMIRAGASPEKVGMWWLYGLQAYGLIEPACLQLLFYGSEWCARKHNTRAKDWGVTIVLFLTWAGGRAILGVLRLELLQRIPSVQASVVLFVFFYVFAVGFVCAMFCPQRVCKMYCFLGTNLKLACSMCRGAIPAWFWVARNQGTKDPALDGNGDCHVECVV